MDSSFVSQLIEKYQIKCDYIHRYIDVVSEIGELGKELLNVTNYGKKTFQATPEVEQEHWSELPFPSPVHESENLE